MVPLDAFGQQEVLRGLIVIILCGRAADNRGRCGGRRQLLLLRVNVLARQRRIRRRFSFTRTPLHPVMLVDGLPGSRVVVHRPVLLLRMHSITADGLLVHCLGIRVLMARIFQRAIHRPSPAAHIAKAESIPPDGFRGQIVPRFGLLEVLLILVVGSGLDLNGVVVESGMKTNLTM